MIKVGDALPAVKLMEYVEVEGNGCSIGPNPVKLPEAAAGKTIAVFAVPGAFTPTCSAKHVPGFVEQAGDPLLQPCIHATSSTAVNRVRTAPRSPWPRAATAPLPVHRRSGCRPSMDPPGTAGKQSAAR